MAFIDWIKSFLPNRKNAFESYIERVDFRVSEKLGKDSREFFEASIEERMSLLAEEAEQAYGLDYSRESLKELDMVFEKLEEEYKDAEIIRPSSKEEVNEIRNERPHDFEYSQKLGVLQNQTMAYLGEVVKNEFGGEWMEKDFSDAFERAGRLDKQGGLAGLSVPTNQDKYEFVNIPDLASQRVKGEITLYEAFESVEDVVGDDMGKSKDITRDVSFDISDMRGRARDISEGLKLDNSSEGLEKLDKVLTVIDYESDVDDIDEFILEVGSFLGVVLEENLEVEVKNLNGEFIIYVPETDLKMRLMEAADNCVKKNEKSLYETYKFFENQVY